MSSPPPSPDNETTPPPPPSPPPGEWEAPASDQTWPAEETEESAEAPAPTPDPAPEGAPQWDPPATTEPTQQWDPPEGTPQWDPPATTEPTQQWDPPEGTPQWDPPATTEPTQQWDPPEGTPQWDPPATTEPTQQWDPPEGTPQWDPPATTEPTQQWDPPEGTPQWDAPAPEGEPAQWAAPAAAEPDPYAPAGETEEWAPPPAPGDPPAEDDGRGAAPEPPAADGHPPPEEPWMPAGFRPDWAIEPDPGAAAPAAGAWPPDPGAVDQEAWSPAPDAPPPPGSLRSWPDPTRTDDVADEARAAAAGATLWPPPPVADPGVGADVVPPPSPAYSAPVAAAYAGEDGGEADAPPAAPPLVPTPAAPPPRGRRRLLVGLAVLLLALLVAAVAALRLGGGDGGGDGFAFGKVETTRGGALVTPAAGERARGVGRDETVRAGWVVQTPGDAAVTVSLTGGGVVRFDKGATLSFLDLAVDPETGRRTGASRPAIQVDGGRIWANPGGANAPHAVRLRLAGGEIVTRNNPVAVDCTVSCRVEAPAGGVTLTSTGGAKATPGAGEAVDFEDPQNLDLLTASAASEWARRNQAADKEDLLVEPVRSDTHSVKGGALVDGTYRLSINFTAPPKGADLPDDVTFDAGDRAAVSLVTDGGECVTVPCDVSVRGENGTKGTARVADGKVTLTFTQPIPCKGPDGKPIIASIGTITVKATMDVLDAAADGKRWIASSAVGDGTLASTISIPCAAGDTLGTATSPIAVSAVPTG